MVQKRLFDDEESYELSYKHPRQLELSDQLVSFSESVFPEDASQIPHTLGEGGITKNDIEGDEKLASDDFTEPPFCSEKDIITSVPGSISVSSWATSSTRNEDDFRSEAPVHVTFLPEYCNAERPIRTLAHCEDIYSLLLEHPPRKAVPVGPNYQVDVPAWGQQSTKIISDLLDTSEAVSDSDLTAGDENEEKLIGTCVIPMPDSEPYAYNSDKVGDGRADCSCQDSGSVRCVRQHIMEAREKLKRILEEERFVKLGFCDMGEQVVEKWTQEEEKLFHRVVFSNPASSGKNFWEILSVVFPTRTKRDIVSYYFNVFMFRRRAEQNRCDPMNIDSDDDEWQGSDDYGDNELGMTEGDEDSVVESPVYQDDLRHNQSREDDTHEYDEDVVGEDNEDVDCGSGWDITVKSKTCPGKLLDNSNPAFQLQDKKFWDERGDQEVQDDSCISSDTGGASQGTQMKADCCDHYLDSCNGLGTSGGHGYVLEHCDAKVWDTGYMTCSKNDVDFLPTSCMIEEVFGDGSWNCKARDGKGLS